MLQTRKSDRHIEKVVRQSLRHICDACPLAAVWTPELDIGPNERLVNYLNLVGSYLMAAAQVNFAVGLEVIR